MSFRRPEHKAPPEVVSTRRRKNNELFRFIVTLLTSIYSFIMKKKLESTPKSELSYLPYTDDSIVKLLHYRTLISSSRIIEIQEEMTERAIELLLLPEATPCLLLDLGCGSGLSGNVLEEQGHTWIGLDISSSMLRKHSSNLALSELRF